MSTDTFATATRAAPPSSGPSGHEAASRARARARALAVRRRLSLATDALAAADLLLGAWASLRSVSGGEGARGR
jgi:hypothetical protein